MTIVIHSRDVKRNMSLIVILVLWFLVRFFIRSPDSMVMVMLARNSALPRDTVMKAYISGMSMTVDSRIMVLPKNERIMR